LTKNIKSLTIIKRILSAKYNKNESTMSKDTMNANTTGLLTKIKDIEPLIRQYAEEAEQNRTLSMPVVKALRDAGFFRMWTPKGLGGLEVDLPTSYRIFETLADIDSAVGWAVPNANGPLLAGAYFPSDVAEEIYGDPLSISAGSPNPPGKATKVDGGYKVNGTISYVSGCDFATHVAGSALIYQGNEIQKNNTGHPVPLRIVFRAEDVEILGNWDTLGMLGTGSHDVKVSDVFVEEKYTHFLGPLDTLRAPYDGPLYRCGPIVGTPFVTVVCLSSANNALNLALDLASKKTPAFMRGTVGDRPVAQAQLAEAKAKIVAARLYLRQVMDDIWEEAVSGHRTSSEFKVALQLAACHGTKAAGEALDLVYGVVGATGIQRSQPFERYHRDIRTLMQHAFTSISRFESAGKLMVGRETDWPFLKL